MGSQPDPYQGKADDSEEEPGTSTQGDRRGIGSGIRRKIHRDNVGKILVAAGPGSNLHRLLERGEKPKDRRATRIGE